MIYAARMINDDILLLLTTNIDGEEFLQTRLMTSQLIMKNTTESLCYGLGVEGLILLTVSFIIMIS